MKNKKNRFGLVFETIATRITKITGSSTSFLIAIGLIVVWAVSGPFFNYSDTWQLVINTGTTIITFLMVFIIQQSQNKDTMAMQLKLNELLAATKGASNRLVDIEDLTEQELIALKRFYTELAELAERELDLLSTHSIDEAAAVHSSKLKERQLRTIRSTK